LACPSSTEAEHWGIINQSVAAEAAIGLPKPKAHHVGIKEKVGWHLVIGW
jgi:hypothetical protein